jgi:hypothetical protein
MRHQLPVSASFDDSVPGCGLGVEDPVVPILLRVVVSCGVGPEDEVCRSKARTLNCNSQLEIFAGVSVPD